MARVKACSRCRHPLLGDDTSERHLCGFDGCVCPVPALAKPAPGAPMFRGFLVYIAAKNDKNGNPRRGWVHYSPDGIPVAFYCEGYSSHGAIPEEVQRANLPETGRFNVLPVEYNYWMKWEAKRQLEKAFAQPHKGH